MRHGTEFIKFGPVRQEAGAKHVRKGDLLEAVNVRQTAKAGVYAKRRGFTRTAQTFVGGSLIGTPETVLPGQAGNSLMRDTGDQLWARSSATNTWSLMGTHRRPWPEVTTVQSHLYTTPQPFSCMVGTSIWAFALTTNAYEFSIIDAATGVVTTSRIAVTATGVVHASAVYDGTNVWVFWVDNGANGIVRCHKFVVATPATAPTATTYYQFGTTGTYSLATLALQQVQARYLSAIGKVAVVACGASKVSTTFKRGCVHSYLDPATGLAIVAGAEAAVSNNLVAYSGTLGTHEVGGLYILDGQDGSASTWQFVLVSYVDPNVNVYKLRVNATTLSTWSFKAIAPLTAPFVDYSSYACTGFVDNANDRQYVFYTRWDNGAAGGGMTNLSETFFVHVSNNDVTLSSPAAPYTTEYNKDWVASGFATSGGRWFAVTGYDDFGINQPFFSSEGNSIQRCFHVREFVAGATADLSKFSTLAQVTVGNGPALWHRNTTTITVALGSPLPNCVPPLHSYNGVLLNAHSVVSGALGYVDLAITRTTVAKVYGKSVQSMGRGFSPGGIPVTWNGQCPSHEIAPLIAPSYLSVTAAGTGSDFSIAAVVYAIYDNDGTIWRSSPFILSATIGHGATLTFPSPPAWMSGTSLYAEIYIGNNATPKLQASFPISGTVLPLTWVTPTVAAMVNGEILYTTGNALSQTWPVPCQAMGTWGNRLFAAQGNRVWTSKELEPGFGPLFNEVQVSTWSEEQGDITAMAPIDFNYLAIFSSSKPGVISGPGPDGVGNGNYVIRTLSSLMGVSPGGIALQGPQGCHYQDPGTGRLVAITNGLQVVDCGGGAWDYSAYVVNAAAWHEAENLMVFFAAASNAALVIDYQHPQDVAPFGQMYLWTFAAGFVPSAVCLDSSGLLVVSSAGGIFRPGSAWVDDNASGTTDTYRWKLATAELQLGDLQGEIFISKVQALLTMRTADSISIDVYPGYASATLSDARVTSKAIALPAPANVGNSDSVATRPANCARVQSIRVVLQEAAGQTGQGAEVEGLAIDYAATGRALYPNAGRVI